MLGGRKGNGKQGIPPEETKPAFRFIGILDVSSKDDWMKDMDTKAYREEFFPQFFTNWVADFQAILGEEVYYRDKHTE
jgi:hypothetical protein